MHDAAYILKLTEEMIDLIGEQNVMQITIDNELQYKTVGELLME